MFSNILFVVQCGFKSKSTIQTREQLALQNLLRGYLLHECQTLCDLGRGVYNACKINTKSPAF